MTRNSPLAIAILACTVAAACLIWLVARHGSIAPATPGKEISLGAPEKMRHPERASFDASPQISSDVPSDSSRPYASPRNASNDNSPTSSPSFSSLPPSDLAAPSAEHRAPRILRPVTPLDRREEPRPSAILGANTSSGALDDPVVDSASAGAKLTGPTQESPDDSQESFVQVPIPVVAAVPAIVSLATLPENEVSDPISMPDTALTPEQATSANSILEDYVTDSQAAVSAADTDLSDADASRRADERFRSLFGSDAFLRHSIEAARLRLANP